MGDRATLIPLFFMLEFTIKIKALSENHCYSTNKQGRRFLTDEGKRYKELIYYEAKKVAQNVGMTTPFLDVNWQIEFIFGFADRRRREPSNYIKMVQDALEGVFYSDDRQVWRVIAEKRLNCKENYIIIRLKPYKTL